MELTDPLTEHFRLVQNQKQALTRLHIETIKDLLYHLPTRYENIRDIRSIAGVAKGDEVVVYGTITDLKARKAWKSKRPIAEGKLTDATGSIKVMWFNQPYLANMIESGAIIKASGKIQGESGKLYLANPEVERVSGIPELTDDSLFANGSREGLYYPVYPETRGITSKWFYHALKRVLSDDSLELSDPVPEDIKERYKLPDLRTALIWIHAPQKEGHHKAARKRFSFEEVFFIQLAKQKERAAYDAKPSFTIDIKKSELQEFIDRFDFTPTKAQTKAIDEILADFKTPHAMSRLLEGDVGSGKTFVAAATAWAVVTSQPDGQDFGNLQVAYMAPTEILAQQHFENFIQFFSHLPIKIGLITGSGCRKFPSKVDPTTWTNISKSQLLKWVENGEIPIVFGTHALIQKTVRFKDLAYVIIDEQHRFGTLQRRELIRKDEVAPHLLSMTATPIPRTLALTIYGDLDLTLLDEMPAGRKAVITELIPPDKRDGTYEKVRRELAAGRQAYVICPRIHEPDLAKANAVRTKSVKEETQRIQQTVFPEYTVGMLHGQMSAKEKEEVMEQFADNEIQVLVATSVVEVGVNVPNATTIIIEGAERFGLAQLHQLRGRVIRSTHQAYCYIFTDSKAKPTMDRLKALTTAKSGFELAERDLDLRGPGELAGKSQWGISDVGMEALKNIKMVEAARTEAQRIIEKDPELKKHAALAAEAEHRAGELHFE